MCKQFVHPLHLRCLQPKDVGSELDFRCLKDINLPLYGKPSICSLDEFAFKNTILTFPVCMSSHVALSLFVKRDFFNV